MWCADLNAGEEQRRCGQVQGPRSGVPSSIMRQRCGLGGLSKMGPKKLADRGVGVQSNLVTVCGKGKVFSRREVRGCVNQAAVC